MNMTWPEIIVLAVTVLFAVGFVWGHLCEGLPDDFLKRHDNDRRSF